MSAEKQSFEVIFDGLRREVVPVEYAKQIESHNAALIAFARKVSLRLPGPRGLGELARAALIPPHEALPAPIKTYINAKERQQMTTKSDTPRTDAKCNGEHSFAEWREHARSLERETVELRAALEWYADRVSGIHGNDDAEALEEDQGARARAILAKYSASTQ